VLKNRRGRILTGQQAKALGLVDALGNLEDTVAEAGRMGGIPGEPKVVHAAEEEDLAARHPQGRDAIHDRRQDGRRIRFT
jgi:ClpP class serine protease